MSMDIGFRAVVMCDQLHLMNSATQICGKCGKPLEPARYGTYYCRKCINAYNRQWRANNKERVAESCRRDYIKNRDRFDRA